MARIPNDSDRDVSADPPAKAADTESLARLLDQSEVMEVFDAPVRLRFGQLISNIALRSAKHRRG